MTRYYRAVLYAVVAAVGLGWAAPAAAQSDERPPNVVIIYTDDQGSVDLNSYGTEDIVTPATDALAERGVRFTQMYAPAPICSASRAGLMTGRYPPRAGVPSNVGRDGSGLSGVPTMAHTFKEGGYATGLVGKWHLGHGEKTRPDANGFDHWFGHLGGCIDNYSHFFYWAGPNEHDLWRNGEEVYHDGEYFPDLVVDEAEQFIDEHRDEPFFLYVAMNTPHYPYQGEEHWLEHYNEAGVAYPRNLYSAFVSSQEERIARLMEHLEARGLREDTIVVFQSDHGHSTEERAHFGGGEAGPYRGAKFSVFEGGIRVVSIVSYPGHIAEGEVRKQMVHGMDWLPTLAELCGVELLDDDIDGKSIVPVIESAEAPSPHESLYWQFGNQWAVRHEGWKLIANVRDPVDGDSLSEADKRLFLANVESDPGESRNFAEEHPEVVERLRAMRPDWAK